MTDNIKISDFVSLIETYGVVPLRSTSTISNIVNSSGAYTFTIASVTDLAVNDNVVIAGTSGLNGYTVRVASVGTLNFTATQYFTGTKWAAIGTVVIGSVDDTYTKTTPVFQRGMWEQMNRLADEGANTLNKYPAIFMTNYWMTNIKFNKNSQFIDVVYPKLTFCVFIQTKTQTNEDKSSLWETDFDLTNAIALNFIENLRELYNSVSDTDRRRVIIPDARELKFDNHFMFDDIENDGMFDFQATGTVFELPLTVLNGRIICP